MSWFYKITGTLLLLLWVPATFLCFVERGGLLSGNDGCPSHFHKAPGHQHTDASPCCSLASGDYKTQDDHLTAAPPVAFPLFFAALPDLDTAVGESHLNTWAPRPPGLAAFWRFALRTAAAPRAPPFVA
jgi:hypothetical protein